ncbi:MAG TPA: RdgB/HAM1 family non-canonical purine NTP pyrophosphatase [Sphingobacteriaceae bacterium]
MNRTLIFATNNQHKLEEVQHMVGTAFILKSLNDIGCTEDIAETGITFHENASLKSQYIFRNYGLDCFGDDSGLEIDALNGQPGVYSARYSGSRDMDRNIRLVLDKLKGSENRRARFKTVISLVLNGREHYFEGTVEGVITDGLAGNGGFGYDPIFRPDGYDLTFAEMDLEEKNRISHRSKAIRKLVDFLKEH